MNATESGESPRCHAFFTSLTRPLSWTGFFWATALPAAWLLFFYTFVVHVRLSLGRWPEFGERLDGWLFAFYDEATRLAAGALLGSLIVAPVILVVCLFFRRWRALSVYVVAYGAAVGLATGAMFLAPGPFLNWYFD